MAYDPPQATILPLIKMSQKFNFGSSSKVLPFCSPMQLCYKVPSLVSTVLD